MAKPKDKRSARLFSLRLKELRLARRAMRRRRKLLRNGDKKGAYNALRVARRHRRKAQGLLAARRERRKAVWLARKLRHKRKVRRQQGLVWYDGKQVAAWVADELDKARKNGWRGYVVSGYRTPAYSEQLCYGMCGRARCPGMCAGRSSNHSQGYIYPHGAVDVTDYYNLAYIAARLGLRIKNRLPRDRVHFSSSGV